MLQDLSVRFIFSVTRLTVVMYKVFQGNDVGVFLSKYKLQSLFIRFPNECEALYALRLALVHIK